MTWRPKDWDIDKLIDKFDETKPATEFDYFEAGADAMLRAIKDRGYISGASLRNVKGAIGWAGIDPNSRWYPIPEVKKDGDTTTG